jgi:hypothetical protein
MYKGISPPSITHVDELWGEFFARTLTSRGEERLENARWHAASCVELETEEIPHFHLILSARGKEWFCL